MNQRFTVGSSLLYAIFFTLRESRRTPDPALPRVRSSLTTASPLVALALKPSDFCNDGVETDFLDRMAAIGAGVKVQRMPSIGMFSSPLTVDFLFGVPRSGRYAGRMMDVKQSILAVASTHKQSKIDFLQQSGVNGSFLKGSVFDQLLSKRPSNGISAAQLLIEASAKQIPIYEINSGNLAAILPLLAVDSDVRRDISIAAASGKIVIVPERDLQRQGWSGVGYIILDPDTGAGAYLISGGINGGEIIDCEP